MIYCKTGNLRFFLKKNWRVQRRAWRYQRGNQNLHIEKQTSQWPKEKNTKGQTTIYKTNIEN